MERLTTALVILSEAKDLNIMEGVEALHLHCGKVLEILRRAAPQDDKQRIKYKQPRWHEVVCR